MAEMFRREQQRAEDRAAAKAAKLAEENRVFAREQQARMKWLNKEGVSEQISTGASSWNTFRKSGGEGVEEEEVLQY